MSKPRAHVFLVPGLFGFGELAGYDYFAHFERELGAAYHRRSLPVALHVVAAPPTASIPRRAAILARAIAASAADDGPVHIVGHSTGALDARLLLSRGATIDVPDDLIQTWRDRTRSIVGVNCPHHGTPLASYFTTVSGTRLLYAMSLLTFASLSVGRLPLTALSGLVAAIAAVDDAVGPDIQLIDKITQGLLKLFSEAARQEVRDYLEAMHRDQGGIVQLMPESMQLFNAAVHDADDVRYGCVATAAPPPRPRRALKAMVSPNAALQLAVYTTVHSFAGRHDPQYPYASPDPETAGRLRTGLGLVPTPSTVDGIVPTLSMLWGELLWCGQADHLDVVGHFDGGLRRGHVDWLSSGARFSRADFHEMVERIADFQIRAAHHPARSGP